MYHMSGIGLKFWSSNLKERDNLENVGVNGMIVLELILEK
jgi:hypothetical protein